MSYQKDRDEFMGAIMEACEHVRSGIRADSWEQNGIAGSAIALARLVLRNATTIQRCEEAVCSSEAADRDRVPCPAIKSKDDSDCCCDCYPDGEHCDTPRVQVAILRARQRIAEACKPWGIKPNFSGDPRGCCVKLLLPSGRYNSWGGAEDGFCVPVR